MIRFVLDNAGGEAVMAASGNGKLLFQTHRAFTLRESGALMAWVKDVFDAEKFDVNTVDEWLCGTGPGSFSGLRAAGAAVAGLAHGSGCGSVQGIPSALGTASVCPPETADMHAAVLYDGRNAELLYYGLTARDGLWFPSGDNGVIEAVQLPALAARFDKLFSLEINRPLLNGFEPIVYVPRTDAGALLNHPFRMNPAELVYLRPAVFVAPRTVRQVV